jgi:chitinase
MKLRRLACSALLLGIFWFGATAGIDAAQPAPASTAPRFVYSPYKFLPIAIDRDTHIISTAITGAVSPFVLSGVPALSPGTAALTWAFANGECGTENWGHGLDAQRVADANVAAFDKAGVNYIISTGGEGGVFTCATDAGMDKFIARYLSPHLIGIDFDIEAGQTAEVIDALVQRAKVAQRKYPQLRFSFTLATFAASDGSLGSLNAKGESVMSAIRKRGLSNYFLNLMVMDYGAATAEHCVVIAGLCDMGRSAIQAVVNVNKKFGVPLDRIELTPMIGVNDVVANVFTLQDALVIANYARDNKLGGVHFWSLDRDVPCVGVASGASPTCSSLNDLPSLAFTKAFYQGLR